MSSETLGRITQEEQDKGVIQDSPSKILAAVLTKQDEILDKLNEILAATDGAADGNALNTALNALDLSELNKVKLFR